MGLEVAAIGGVVVAIAKYIAMSKLGEKAVEKVGEAGGDAIVAVGKRAYERLTALVHRPGKEDPKVAKSLANVEEDPEDEDYQAKLTKELGALAGRDPEARELLLQLVKDVQPLVGNMTGVVNVSDQGKVDQAAGVNTGTMVYKAPRED
jgi:hypothetical protein